MQRLGDMIISVGCRINVEMSEDEFNNKLNSYIAELKSRRETDIC